jgi:hypothetical protein
MSFELLRASSTSISCLSSKMSLGTPTVCKALLFREVNKRRCLIQGEKKNTSSWKENQMLCE